MSQFTVYFATCWALCCAVVKQHIIATVPIFICHHNSFLVNNDALLHLFFYIYKQTICKQQALGWQIAKQLLGLNPLSLSNNKNYKLSKSGVFSL